MRILRTRSGQASAIFVVCLALFVARPGANWLRARIVRSISLALGRQVEVGSVNLRLLPQPGFDLENFVVYDDAVFGAEPVLRAQQVTAAIRLTSVLHRRLEIARLNLSEPSFNLVRSADGHWNIENLLQRAMVRTPAVSKAKNELRPAFPYIAADRGRINFKFGQEKKPYSLTEADFALWQESDNGLAIRLRARPVRTDFNLTDTGMLRIEGSWQKAATLRETPLQFNLLWEQAQLGQVTKLAYGNDKGWRGAFAISSQLAGTPANLSVITDGSIQDFRRYDLQVGGGVGLAAHCEGRYSVENHRVSGLACQAPVGDGLITLGGNFALLPENPAYELALMARSVPLQSLVALAQHAKKNLPADLIATGRLDANFKLARRADVAGGRAVWQGGGETSGFRLSSRLTETELDPGKVSFLAESADNANAAVRSGQRIQRAGDPVPERRLNFGPVTLALGRPAPAKIQGWISPTGYDFTITGDAGLQGLLHAARTAGLPASQFSADGLAKIALEVGGSWTGFAAPQITGRAQLHSLRAEVHGLNAPLIIAAANLVVAPDAIIVNDLNASAGGTRWQGSLTLARPCATPATCAVRFDLGADRIATEELGELFNPHPQRPWYRFLSPAPPPRTSFFSSLHAAGMVRANQVLIHKVVASRVSAVIHLQKGLLLLSDLQGEFLGGKHRGEWKVDFSSGVPMYSGRGVLDGVALDQLAADMHDDWVSGTATATYQVTASGIDASELLSSADADLQIEARDGALPHIMLAGGTGELRMNHFTGRMRLHESNFEIEQGKLETPAGIYQLSGTASLGRVLDLKLAREGGHGFSVTGTLAEPRVVQTADTRAALKP